MHPRLALHLTRHTKPEEAQKLNSKGLKAEGLPKTERPKSYPVWGARLLGSRV